MQHVARRPVRFSPQRQLRWCVLRAGGAHGAWPRRPAARRAALRLAEQARGESEARFRRAKEQLQRAERLASIGTLAAGIAHEINNPVGGILISAESAAAELAAGGDLAFVSSCLNEIVEDARRCGRIIQSILRFARQQPTEKWPNDVNALVKRALHLTRERMVQRGGELSLQLDPSLPLVSLNPTEFEQVLINLIQNAVEAGGEGARVIIRTERLEDGVRVRVRDTGPGMTRDQLEHVFDPFFTTRQNQGGTGLGLSVVHGIIEGHGGRIDVDSSPGEGATFTIELPCWPKDGGGASHGSSSCGG